MLVSRGLRSVLTRLSPQVWAGSRGTCQTEEKQGLVIGVYEKPCPGEYKLTQTAKAFDSSVDGKITELLKEITLKKNKPFVFGNVGDEFYQIAVTNLGPDQGDVDEDGLNVCRENIRSAAGTGVIALQDQDLGTQTFAPEPGGLFYDNEIGFIHNPTFCRLVSAGFAGYSGITQIFVEDFSQAEAASEGAHLGVWVYQEWRHTDGRHNTPKIHPYKVEDETGWKIGTVKAESQNIARFVEQTPSNLMTPMLACRYAAELLCGCGVKVEFWDKNWLETNRFSAFLSLAKGACEPPAILHLSYCGGSHEEKPIVVMGKGATFDSGGINLRRGHALAAGRETVAAAGVAIGLIKALARMQLPLNVVVLIALYENMPSGMAIKPGDVLVARNGKTVLMEDAATTGRIVSADVLTYLSIYQPCLILHMSMTETSAAPVLGYPATGVWSTSNVLWDELERAGMIAGDRFWRLPIWKYFAAKIKNVTADTLNRGKGPGAPQMLVPFLLEFSPPGVDFMHLDLTETGQMGRGFIMPYLRKGMMTGRPTRSLLQFLYQVACPHDPLTVPCAQSNG